MSNIYKKHLAFPNECCINILWPPLTSKPCQDLKSWASGSLLYRGRVQWATWKLNVTPLDS